MDDSLSSRRNTAASHLVTIVTATAILAAAYFARDILIPLALAVLLSFILSPLVRWIERHMLPRVPAVIIVVAVAFSGLGAFGYLVTNQVLELGEQLPSYKGNLIDKVRAVSGATQGRLEKATETIKDIGEELSSAADKSSKTKRQPASSTSAPTNESSFGLLTRYLIRDDSRQEPREDDEEQAVSVKVVSLPPSPLEQIRSWLGPVVAPLTTAGLVVVLTLFLLLKHEEMRNRVLQLVGPAHLRVATEALSDATQRISNLLRMQLAINVAYGASVGLGLYVLGLPNAMLWGVLGVLLRFLPYVGPWMVAAFPIVLSLAVFDDWTHVLMVIGLFLALEIVVNNVLEPWLYGASMGVSSIGVIVAAIFWTWMWGPIGLVLAMPITVCLVVAGKYVPQLQFLTVLFGDESPLSLQERLYQRLLALDDEEVDHILRDYSHSNACGHLFDDVLVPTLRLAENDRHAGTLDPRQQTLIFDTIREIAEEQTCREGQMDEESPQHDVEGASPFNAAPLRVVLVPARDEADEIAATMLRQLTGDRQFAWDVYSRDTLASELINHAARADVVVISALPPGTTRHARYLCKRLQSELPHVHVMVGLWSGDNRQRSIQRLRDAGAHHVATRLSAATRELRSWLRLRRADSTVARTA
ncbi:MAG: AI-2E family transporter [Planctomycetales bacterium]|nr:AI-2E family transporter [Planctomycetales bacterium]